MKHQTVYEFQKVHLKIETDDAHLFDRGDHKKTIRVIKYWHVNCAPVTGISKQNVMPHKTDVYWRTSLALVISESEIF